MKLVTIRNEIFEKLKIKEFLLDLQKAQVKGHRPYPYWNASYIIPPKQLIAIPENVYACWTGKLEGVMGSQYKLEGLFNEEQLPETIKLPSRIIGLPSKESLKGKKLLCVLAHNSFGLGDLILAMPFLKMLVENLDVELSLCVNAAGVSFFNEQNWVTKVYPEILPFEKLVEFDFFVEPSVNKMDTLSWVRSFALKEFGEKAFHNRFPSPELVAIEAKKEEFINNLNSHPKRDTNKKLCLFNWETSSQKRNLPVEVIKTILKSLQIMDFQVVITKPIFKSSEVFNWARSLDNVIDASPFTVNPSELVNIVESSDLVVTADTSFVHLAGGLRKRTLCIFLKTATELYKKAWLKGTYWPYKAESLYPTLKSLTIPGNHFKDMDKIIYKSVRETAFGEDPEIVELYNNLFSLLKNRQQLADLEEVMKRKNIDFKKLAQNKIKQNEDATT